MKYFLMLCFLTISSFGFGQVSEVSSNLIDNSTKSSGPISNESKKTIGIIRVNTDGAKLTKSENQDSQVLESLNRGQILELLEIIFPDGLKNTSRYLVRYNSMEAYITSFFIEPMILIGSQQISLKQLELSEISKKEVEQLRVRDSLLQIRVNQNREYFDKLKVDDEEVGRKNDSIAEIFNRNVKLEAVAARESKLSKRKAVFVKKYGLVNGEKVSKSLIWIGMTEEMLYDSWGQPEDINTSVTRYGTRKQYVYGSGQYVYVENGKVDAWQD
jgi:hypothetical protein